MSIEKSILEVVKKHLDEKVAELETEYRNKIAHIERDYFVDRYYTTKEAATYLSVPEAQLTKWAREGRMPRYNFGNKTFRFRRSELDAFAMQTKEEKKEEQNTKEEETAHPHPLSIGKSVFQQKKKAAR